jgi:Cu/Ag efflux protein CusF
MIRLSRISLGVIAFAVLLAMPRLVLAEDTKGTVRSINADKNEVVLKGLLKDTTYGLNKDGNVFLDGRKGKIADLREGDRAHIIWNKQGEQMMASEVRCLRKASETTGTVRSVAADKQEFVLKGVIKDTTYRMEKDGNVLVDGRAGALADLKEGDNVIVTYETRGSDLMVSEVRITRRVAAAAAGN